MSIDINLLDLFGNNLDGDDNNNSVTPITFFAAVFNLSYYKPDNHTFSL